MSSVRHTHGQSVRRTHGRSRRTRDPPPSDAATGDVGGTSSSPTPPPAYAATSRSGSSGSGGGVGGRSPRSGIAPPPGLSGGDAARHSSGAGGASSARGGGGGGAAAGARRSPPPSSSGVRPTRTSSSPTSPSSTSPPPGAPVAGSRASARSAPRSVGGGGGGRSRASAQQQQQPVAAPPPSALAGQESLREIVKRRILSDVFDHSGEKWPGWMVMVVDERSMRVVSSVMGMYDLMEHRVAQVESLSKKRAPFKDMAAIYVVAPTEENVNKIKADYQSDDGEKREPLYGGPAFLYFLSRIPNSLLGKIKECRPLLRRIKALGEVNVDFLAKEGRAFHLDMDSCFAELFRRRQGPSRVEMQIVDRLVTLCATMNEYPHIRYPADSRRCKNMAMAFHDKINEFVGASPNWWYHGGGGQTRTDRERSTLLIMDRSVDALSPLMHEFTYQAMVNDLLPIEDDRISYKSDNVVEKKDGGDADVEQVDKDVLLNENDELWVELRGKHIADVIQTLSSRIKEIVSSSGAASLQKDSGKNMSLSQMAAALKALPEYQEVMSKLSQHMHISHQCMGEFNKQGLLELAELEQTLATGQTEEGRKAKLPALVDEVEGRLPTMDPDDALRLLAIFIISQNGMLPQDKMRLYTAAGLDVAQKQTLQNLETLGVSLEQVPGTRSRNISSMFGGRSLVANSAQSDSEYASSRYACKLKGVLEDLAADRLSIEEYPSVLPLPIGGSGTAASVRSKNRSARTSTSRWNTDKKKAAFTGGRQIVFISGGMCYSELRSAQEVMERGEKEIIVGSTSFVKPSKYLSDLGTLGRHPV